jgi:hypothetical protein
MHPGAVRGIERNIMHPQQRLTVLRFRNGGAGHLEMFGAEFAGRLLHQQHLSIQDLAIHARAHGFSSLGDYYWRLLMQPSRSKRAAVFIVRCMQR